MKKVMIVDDNALSAEGIVRNIDWELLDAEVVHVENNGDSAIESMRRAPVDLIISDIEMPNLDGISMSSLALSVNPLVKIILISAYDKFEYAKRAIRLGVCDYIEKPLDYGYLTEKIRNAFTTIDREQHNRELVEQSRPLMTEKFFSDLLHYSGKDAAGHLGRYPGYLNLNLDFSCFNVLKLEVENASQAEDELGITQYQIELLNVCDLLGEQCKGFGQVYFVKEFNGIIAILAQNTNSPGHFLQAAHKAVAGLMEKYREGVFSLNVGIGTVVEDFWDLHISYENASHALKYRFFFPHKNIFDAREALGREFSLFSFSESKEEELIRLLCQKNAPAIEEWLRGFFQEVSLKYQTKNIVFIRIYSLLGRILKFLYELNIDTGDLENDIISVYNHFELFHTYEEFFKWMNHLCLQVCEKLDTSLQTYHDQVCELVLCYIRENYEDNTLCLGDIAGHANVSPAYLSALFKKVYGQSISDTITALRIEAACQYLKNSTLSLKEISSRCGYANQYYFSNSFKKKLGMSPSAYREQHSEI